MKIVLLAWTVWILSRHRLKAYAALATNKAPSATPAPGGSSNSPATSGATWTQGTDNGNGPAIIYKGPQ